MGNRSMMAKPVMQSQSPPVPFPPQFAKFSEQSPVPIYNSSPTIYSSPPKQTEQVQERNSP